MKVRWNDVFLRIERCSKYILSKLYNEIEGIVEEDYHKGRGRKKKHKGDVIFLIGVL